jgi:hypothetical protein
VRRAVGHNPLNTSLHAGENLVGKMMKSFAHSRRTEIVQVSLYSRDFLTAFGAAALLRS